MRQTHPAGEGLFFDYVRETAGVIDGATGESRRAQIFVAVLSTSDFAFAEVRWTESLPDQIHVKPGFELLSA